MARDVYLCGTAPWKPAEAFERFTTALPGLLKRVPDGQQYGWMPGKAMARTNHLVRGNDDPIQKTATMETFRPESGVRAEEILFEELQYARAAVENYAIFRELREEGK